MDSIGRIGVPKHTRKATYRAIHGKRSIGGPQGKFTLLSESATLRTADLLVPHNLPAPDPPGPLNGIGQAGRHPPVNEHHKYRARFTGTPDIGQPLSTPAGPAALILLITVEVGQCFVRFHTAVLLVGGSVLFGRLGAAAGVGRIGDDRIKNAGFERLNNAQHIPVQDGPAIAAAVFNVELGFGIYDQVQFFLITQRHPSFLTAPARSVAFSWFPVVCSGSAEYRSSDDNCARRLPCLAGQQRYHL